MAISSWTPLLSWYIGNINKWVKLKQSSPQPIQVTNPDQEPRPKSPRRKVEQEKVEGNRTMAYEAYRVRKSFGWNGWMFAPDGKCPCGRNGSNCVNCTEKVGMDCICHDTSCHCDCGIRSEQYAGDIWLVQEGDGRKEMMLANRFATGDASIKRVDELMEEDHYQQVTEPRKVATLV